MKVNLIGLGLFLCVNSCFAMKTPLDVLQTEKIQQLPSPRSFRILESMRDYKKIQEFEKSKIFFHTDALLARLNQIG